MSTSKNVENILEDLVKYKSITPDDTDCQEYISTFVEELGFTTKFYKYGNVKNMICTLGDEKPVLAFVGHTDVVPPGDKSTWKSDPFILSKEDNYLIGRGTSDMKGGIASFLSAVKSFTQDNEFKGSIKIILTGDEEGDAVFGIRKLVEENIFKDSEIDYCLVGEPSSSDEIGDVIRNGRRGSISGYLTIEGIQGHVAYPEKALNPIHESSRVIEELLKIEFDQGNEFFPPTSFQISNILGGAGVDNVIPGSTKITFNIRYSTETTHNEIINKIVNAIEKCEVKYDIEWKHSGEPYLTTQKELLNHCKDSIKSICGIDTVVSTNGGTSDGRFMAKVCNQVIEFGLTNETIHKTNECVNINKLNTLVDVYTELLCRVFNSN